MRVGKISNLFSVSNAHTIFVSYPNVERLGFHHRTSEDHSLPFINRTRASLRRNLPASPVAKVAPRNTAAHPSAATGTSRVSTNWLRRPRKVSSTLAAAPSPSRTWFCRGHRCLCTAARRSASLRRVACLFGYRRCGRVARRRQVAEAVGSSSHLTPRWREMDSNFRFRASGNTPHRPRGEAASHRSRLPLRRDPPHGATLMMALSVSFSRN
jgi:hypothetical protein